MSSVFLRWIAQPISGEFVHRRNRFAATVRVGKKITGAFLPNPGRMHELLIRGKKVVLEKKIQGKHPYTLKAIRAKNCWVSLDSTFPNRFIKFALNRQLLPFLHNYDSWISEVPVGSSRIDFLLKGSSSGETLFLEVKSVNLVQNGIAYFPDAPSERGIRHLQELSHLAGMGKKTMVLFVVQRQDASAFAPYPADLAFCQAFLQAKKTGVEMRGIKLQITPYHAIYSGEIRLHLESTEVLRNEC